MLLENHFVKEKDYITSLNPQVKQSEHVRGGHNQSGHTTQRNLPFLQRLHLHLFSLSFLMFERFHPIMVLVFEYIYLSNIDHEASAASVYNILRLFLPSVLLRRLHNHLFSLSFLMFERFHPIMVLVFEYI